MTLSAPNLEIDGLKNTSWTGSFVGSHLRPLVLGSFRDEVFRREESIPFLVHHRGGLGR